MKSIKLIFGSHNSQPLGNFDYVNEKIYESAYKPFLRVLYTYPDFPVTLHYSGILFEWIEEHHPELLMLLADMIKRKQVELLGGGFFEPILSVIPNSDKLGQIETLTTYIRSRFGKRPRGSWITERVWEPYLASILKNSGMEYIFLDDIHFQTAGVKKSELFYPYLTEDQGKTVVIYPLSRSLRILVEEKSPEEVVSYIEGLADEDGDKVITLIDDGEKFGNWLGTHNRFYEEKWLDRFISLVLDSPYIEPIHPAKYLKKYDCRGKIYIGCMLYDEMLEWLHASVEAPGAINILNKPQKGGSFRKFFSKYPESNLIYSKMSYVNILVNQIRGDKYKKKAAKDELWKGQCNTVYWHGNFDGLYSSHLRKKVYEALLEAEKLTRDDGVFMPSLIAVDFDTDGKKEYLYQGDEMNAYIHLQGGMLFELDYLPVVWNYLDTLSRYREPYHDIVAKQNQYDWYLRKAFVDHFFDQTTDLLSFKDMRYREAGDFILNNYNLEDMDRLGFELNLRRVGSVVSGGKEYTVTIDKRFKFDGTRILLNYRITNHSSDTLSICYAVENNFSLAAGGNENCNVLKYSDHSVEMADNFIEGEGLSSMEIKDLKNSVSLLWSSGIPYSLWSFPVETMSRTLDVQNKVYQASCFISRWNIELAHGESWENGLELSLTRL